MTSNGVIHDVTYQGSKIMLINVKSGLAMRIVDSFNFLPMALKKIPKTFGMEDIKKGDFPHLFNTLGKYFSCFYC